MQLELMSPTSLEPSSQNTIDEATEQREGSTMASQTTTLSSTPSDPQSEGSSLSRASSSSRLETENRTAEPTTLRRSRLHESHSLQATGVPSSSRLKRATATLTRPFTTGTAHRRRANPSSVTSMDANEQHLAFQSTTHSGQLGNRLGSTASLPALWPDPSSFDVRPKTRAKSKLNRFRTLQLPSWSHTSQPGHAQRIPDVPEASDSKLRAVPTSPEQRDGPSEDLLEEPEPRSRPTRRTRSQSAPLLSSQRRVGAFYDTPVEESSGVATHSRGAGVVSLEDNDEDSDGDREENYDENRGDDAMAASFTTAVSSNDVSIYAEPGSESELFDESAQDGLNAEIESSPIKCRSGDLFGTILPRELQLRCFSMLARSYVDEREQAFDRAASGFLPDERSGRLLDGRWSGDAGARRALVRLSRVSRSWYRLAYDGQLWTDLPCRSKDTNSLVSTNAFGADQLLSVAGEAGAFVRSFDATGCLGVDDIVLASLTANLGRRSGGELGATRLTQLNLTGCTSLTSPVLAQLICQSPELERINMQALGAVDSRTIDALGDSCRQLASINVSRCHLLKAASLARLPSSVVDLRASNLASFSDTVLVSLFYRFPGLRTLDVSYNRQLTDMGWRAVVADSTKLNLIPIEPSEASPHWLSSFLTLVEARRQPITADKKRPLVNLQHLNLTRCLGLTDQSLAHLASCVPSLKSLEVAHMSSTAFQPAGIVKLLRTSPAPALTHLDLEHGSLLTDDMLVALVESRSMQSLTHLVLSSCEQFTAGAIARLCSGGNGRGACPNLRVLEADGTNIDDGAARSFVAGRVVPSRVTQSTEVGPDSDRESSTKDGIVVARSQATVAASKVVDPAVLSLLDARFVSRSTQRAFASSSVPHGRPHNDDDERSLHTRPRTGVRAYWPTVTLGPTTSSSDRPRGYHHAPDLELPDDDGEAQDSGSFQPRVRSRRGTLDECDPSRVVVRSFYGSLAVDAADAARSNLHDQQQQQRLDDAATPGSRGSTDGRRLSITRVLLGGRTRAMSDSAVAATGTRRRGSSLTSEGSCVIS